MNNPWETDEGQQVWKSKSQYFNWLRGNLRKIWSDYPVRKIWKKDSLRPVTSKERLSKMFHPSTKNVGQCVMCNEWMAGSKLECDHKKPSNGCSDWSDVPSFVEYCVSQPATEFQLICKPCHKIKAYAERMNISFEDARIEKAIIAYMKKSNTVIDKTLAKHGLPCNNAKVRKDGVRQLMKENKM